MSEYMTDCEQAVWWSVLGGSSFVKPYFDVHKGRIVAPFIMPQNIIISSGASSVYDAERVTHRFHLTQRQMLANFERGVWVKKRIEYSTQTTDSVTRKVDQVTGLEQTPHEDNKDYTFDECYTFLDISGFEEVDKQGNPTPRYLPYRVIKDKNSNQIVGVWRNYNENDHLFRPKINIIQHKYFTGFNAYGLGMIHLAIGAAKTETKLQQQIIQGAILSNMPNLVQKTGLRTERTQLNFTPGSIPQLATNGEPLANVLMPMPFQPPSQIILDMKRDCSQDIQNISIARELKPDNLPANTSATTVLGFLSTSSDMSNSLIRSYYRSYSKEFQIIYDLLGQTLPDEPYPFFTHGKMQTTLREDFAPDIKIIPVMDPSNSSQTMQIMTSEVLMSLAEQNPDIYNKREVQKRVLNSLKVKDFDMILIPEQEEEKPPYLDPVSENMYVMQGKPILAYKDQDHINHNVIHENDIQRLQQSEGNEAFISALMAHKNEHVMWNYALEMEAILGQPLPDDPTQIPPEVQQQITLRIAEALQNQQQEQQQQSPMPMDPSIPLMEENRIREKQIEFEAQYQHEKIEMDRIRVERENTQQDLDVQVKLKQIEIEQEKIVLERERLMVQREENENRKIIELAKIQLDQQKMNLEIEAKSFSDSLKYESDKYKTDLNAQEKSFSTVMAHEKEETPSLNNASEFKE